MDKISLAVYDPERCRLFALGRNAMYAACRAMGLKEGDEVLTPAFDCDGSLQPFKALGLKSVFYRSDPYDFRADLDDIRKKATPRTKLLHVINHFGMPQPWDDLIALKEDLKTPVMEDNAYSLFSTHAGRPFGTFGDVSVFSLRKNLPLAEGGMLRINNGRYLLDGHKKAPFIYKTEIPQIVRTGLKKIFGAGPMRRISAKLNMRDLPPPPLYSETRDRPCPEWAIRDATGAEFSRDYTRRMSRMTENMLAGLTADYYARMSAGKRDGYRLLAGLLKGLKGVRVLWPDIPEGAVPFSLSLIIEAGRDRLLERLRAGFDVMAWPTLPSEVIARLADFPEVELLGRKLLQINLSPELVLRRDLPRYLKDIAKEIERHARS